MKPIPWKTHIKLLFSDKFERNAYAPKLPSFFISLKEHLTKYSKLIEKAKAKKKTVEFDTDEIFMALGKYIPLLTSRDFNTEITTYVDYVFSTLMHFETNEDIRKKAISSFLQIMRSTPSMYLKSYAMSYMTIVPWPRFARDASERNNISTFLHSSPLVLAETVPGSEADGLNDLHQFLTTLEQLLPSNEEAISSIFIRYILTIIYNPICHDISDRCEHGFYDPPIPSLHASILSFISSIPRIDVLCPSPEHFCLISSILCQIEHVNNDECLIPSFSALKKMLEDQWRPLISTHSEYLTKFLQATSTACYSNPHAFSKTVDFLDSYIHALKKDNPIQEAFENRLKLLIEKTSKPAELSAMTSQCIFHYLLESQSITNSLWDIFLSTLNNDLTIAVISRYVEAIAVSCIPCLWHLDKNDVIEKCDDAVYRGERNKIALKQDFVIHHINEIFENPSKFSETLGLMWPYSVPDGVLADCRIFGPTESLPSTIDLFEFTNLFLDRFEQAGLHSIVFTFFSTLEKLSTFPPEVRLNHSYLYELSIVRLVREIYSQILRPEPHCHVEPGFITLLSNILNYNELRFVVNKPILSAWYAILLSALCEDDHGNGVHLEAFNASVRTILTGFSGSSLLIPPLIRILELIDNPQFIGSYCQGSDSIADSIHFSSGTSQLLNSPALFSRDIPTPRSFLSQVQSKIPESQFSNNKFISEILNDNGSDIKKRHRALLCSLASSPDRLNFLPSLLVTIVEELCLPEPSSSACLELCRVIASHLSNSCEEALQTIRGLNQYYLRLCEVSPESITILASSLLSFTEREDKLPELQLFSIIRCSIQFLVASYPVSKSLPESRKFAAFLASLSHNNTSPFGDFCRYSLEMFIQEFGAFDVETNVESEVNHDSDFPTLFKSSSGTVMKFSNEPPQGARISNLTPGGQFVWKFKSISEIILKVPNNEEDLGSSPGISESLNLTLSESIQPSLEFQTGFTQIIKDIVEKMNVSRREDSLEENLPPMDDTKGFDQDRSIIEKIRPSWIVESPAAAALTIIGMDDSDLRFVRDGDFTRSLLQKAYEIGQKFGVKAALVDVVEGAEDQNEILATTIDKASPHFNEFLRALGWAEDVNTHHGYNGGLDMRDGRAGKTTCYAQTQDHSIMFHVPALLPVDNDPQQVKKKRHVGNDRSQIFWMDRKKEYDIATITSQFGQLQIIIYPQGQGTFRVQIETRSIPWFCPLAENAVVSKEALPSLVRATVGNSTEAAYVVQKDFEHPIMEEMSFVEKVFKKSVEDNYTEFKAITKIISE